MKVILVDDEKMALMELEYCIRKSEGIEILGLYTNPLEALLKSIRQKPDAVFVDINMPELNGLVFADELLRNNDNTSVIFCTAFNEYAIKAFELNAIDYLLKPVSVERIAKTLIKLRKNKEMQNTMINKIDAMRGEIMRKENMKIPIWKGDRIFLCNLSDVEYMCSLGGQTKINTCTGESYVCKDTLNSWEERLKYSNFFRSHRSYLINTDKIEEIIPWFNNTYMLKMKGSKHEIPVSRSTVKAFRKLFNL